MERGTGQRRSAVVVVNVAVVLVAGPAAVLAVVDVAEEDSCRCAEMVESPRSRVSADGMNCRRLSLLGPR